MELLIAAVASVVVEIAKRFFGTTAWGAHLFLLAVSFAFAGGIVRLQSTGLWETFYQITLMAAGIWAVINGTMKELRKPTV